MYSKALRRHTALQVQRSAGPTQAASFEWLERVAERAGPVGSDENVCVAENTFTTLYSYNSQHSIVK
jgi:hypothetical protein